MIIFVPAYDDSTSGNLAVAMAMRPPAGAESLLADHATHVLLGLLSKHPRRPLFAMSHGGPRHLCGQGGAPVLDAETVADRKLCDRVMYIFACHTATELGRIAANHGATWAGYTGWISAPPVTQTSLEVLASVFDFVCASIPHMRDTGFRQRFLLDLEARCEQAAAALDELAAAGVGVELDAYLCLLHVWQRLRIWSEGDQEPARHPDAPPPSLFASR